MGFGTITRGDTGINFSRGRGVAKVGISVSFNDIEEWARKNRYKMPKLIHRAKGTAANILRDQLRKVMRAGGGIYGVKKFREYELFTRELRAIRGKSGPMGGVLAERAFITRWKCGSKQKVGWPDTWIGVLADKFQLGTGPEIDRFPDANYRKTWYKQGVSSVPSAYQHNKRDVMLQFIAAAGSNLETFRKHRLDKLIAKEIAQSRGWNK